MTSKLPFILYNLQRMLFDDTDVHTFLIWGSKMCASKVD